MNSESFKYRYLQEQPSTINKPQNKKTIWVIAFSLFFLFTPLAFIVWKVLRYTGVFMYPLDDTFIHLEIAEQLTHGTWGINKGEFASASSSLLYTIILTIGRLFSSSILLPFVINCIAGVLCVLAVHYWLSRHYVVAAGQVLIILLGVFFAPLALMILSGMEHTLQCLFSFLFIFYFSDWLGESVKYKSEKLPWFIILFAVLTATIRYEGLFLIAIAVCMLLYFKKFKTAFWLGAAAVLPLFAFGLYSMTNGGFILPNSVLIKSDSLNYTGIAGFISNVLFEKLTFARNGMAALATQRWTIILPLLWLAFRQHIRLSESFIFTFLITATVLQLAFAATGYLYRYEAYLFFCSSVFTGYLFYKYGRAVLASVKTLMAGAIALVLCFFLFFPVALRSVTALGKAHQACINIYDQQYHMAQFSKRYYYSGIIAANDIGAISYFTDANIIDLWGLANNEVAKSKKDKYWNPVFLDSLSRRNKVPVAMIYDVWFNNALHNHWKKVATWQIQNNVICGDDVVTFYAIDSTQSKTLLNNLMKYQSYLPSSVRVKYY